MSSIIRATTTSGLQIAPDNSGSLQLQTNGTTAAVTIDTSQNVGIGSTPIGKFSVKAGASSIYSVAEAGNLYLDSLNGTATAWSQVNNRATTHVWMTDPSTTPVERMRIDSSGNVGIGATSPTGLLEISKSQNADTSLKITNTNAGTSARGNLTIAGQASNYQIAVNDTYIQNYTAQNLVYQWWNAGTERMRIDSSGSLIIAGTSPYSSGYLFNIMPSSGAASAGLKGVSGAGAFMYFNDTGGTAVESRIGHVTNINAFQVRAGATGGVGLTSGATSWTSLSDETKKDIIEPIENAIEKVLTLRAVIGKYKDDEEGIRRSFLIAQDVEKVLPEAITKTTISLEDSTEYLSLAYTDTIPLIVAAIKEQQTIINDLKARIETLEAK